MAKEYYTLTKEDGVQRIDKFLVSKFPEYSRSALAKLFTMKMIKHDGESYRAGEKVRPGTTIEYNLAPLKDVPEVIELPVVYEDDNVIVVDKPTGIISHARGKFWQEASVASFIRDKVSNGTGERAGIVHRLDRATSGVMVCAKNPETLSYLQKQFSERTVTKTYIAVVSGVPKINSAIIDAPIQRNPNKPREFMVDKNGKVAQTKYSLIKNDKGMSTLMLEPQTGRTHQLRVHLNYIKLPIIGDDLYKGESYPRLMLHAKCITIKLPGNIKKTFEAGLPKEFEKIYEN